jgi:hypothetical protein
MSTEFTQFNSPDYKCKAYLEMMEPLRMMRDVLGGTPALRAAGETYLPKQPKEKPEEYEARKKRSISFNATKKTSTALVGMVYKENPKLKDDVPDQIKQHWNNIDLAGSHGDVFTKTVFESAINDGHSFILVDMAKPVPPTLTRREEMGRRPYWLHYTKDQAHNWYSDRINGEEVLTQITFRETACVRVGRYGEKEVIRERTIYLPVLDDGLDANGIQIRPPVYGTMEWELQQEAPDAPEGAKWRLVDSGQTKLSRVPYAVVYGKKTGFLTSEPLLLDLGYLNVDWYQQNSDYRAQLNKLVPILLRLGLPDALQKNDDFLIGPGALADQPNETDLKYISHDGKALEATRQALMDTEQRMAMSGLSILTQRADSNITATEKKMDQGERTSELATAARSLRDGIEAALGFHAQYLNLQDQMGDGGAIDLGVAQDDLVIDGQMLTALNNMVSRRRLTLETLHAYMQRGLKGVDLTNEIEALKNAEPPTEEPPLIKEPTVNKPEEGMMNGGVQ